ncbi:hypothetical protein V6R98_26855, partial [Agrobacterium sp. CCNWLW71]|uniref:hypothetical protein n=1 Tax=unclassified Agrobacterium TaxID=2632611 RepID=UPI002FF0CAA3
EIRKTMAWRLASELTSTATPLKPAAHRTVDVCHGIAKSRILIMAETFIGDYIAERDQAASRVSFPI